MVSCDRTFADAVLLLLFSAAAVLVVELDPAAAAAADTTGGMVEEDDVEATEAAALVDWKRAFMRDSVLLQVHGSAIVTFQKYTASWSALPFSLSLSN